MVEIGRDSRCLIRPRRMSELWGTESPDGVRVLSDARLALEQFHLNGVAGAIWRLCDGNRTVDAIIQEIAASFEGPGPSHETLISDVLQFLDSLQSQELLTWEKDKKLDVLLIVPPAPGVYAKEAVKTPEYSSPPLGLCYIAAVLRDHGYDVGILDLHQCPGLPEDAIAACREHNPAIVGITATTPTYPNAERVARFVKAWKEDCTIVLGGPHATCDPVACIASGSFDFCCIGEGEYAMLDLTKALITGATNPKTVSGFVFSDTEGRVVHTPPRTRLKNLDTLPFPARDLLDLDSYHQKGAIISSRGCPIGCNFCACTAIVGQTYRTHSVDYVIKEMQYLIGQYNYRHFDFHDDTFNLHPKRVFEFCRAITNAQLDVEWGCFCRAAQMTPAMAKSMAKAGCSVIQYGVESGNDTVLRSINKQTSIAQIESAVCAAADAGIEQIVCGFIIGHATDTAESVRDTLNFGLRLRDLGATRLTLSLLTPYPGTSIFENRRQLGIKLLTNDWEQYTFSRVIMETSKLNKDELRELYVEGLSLFLDATIK